MQIPSNEKPHGSSASVPDLVWVNRISKLMDSKFTVPGTRFKFGLDPILGLIPFAGDAASLVVSGVLVAYMARYGASRRLVILMIGNIVLDALFGSIPIIGGLFDFVYKANDRNVRLLQQYYTEGKHQGKGTGLLLLLGLIILLLLAGLVYGFAKLIEWVFSYF